jgi:anti-sigma regulatory factor (Ser/Thr protein kinase)
MRAGPDTLHVEVSDPGVGFERRRLSPNPVDEGSGYGLRIVDRLADRWGVSGKRGTVVWFDIENAE